MPDFTSISARWIASGDFPPIPDGIIRIRDGRIVSVGPADGTTATTRFDDAILLPGLVNAHTHLDLTGAAKIAPQDSDLLKWLKSVVDYRIARCETDVVRDIDHGIQLCLHAGTTMIGDISVAGRSAARLRNSPLRATVFFELTGLSPDRFECVFATYQRWKIANDDDLIKLAVSPHAPYSIRHEAIGRAAGENCPVAIHLAESANEFQLLSERAGSFVPFLASLGIDDLSSLAKSHTEIMQLLPDRPTTLLVHANYLDTSTLPRHMTLVYCPRTHAAFGHEHHPFEDFLARGSRVVLATDSLASNPDLSVLNEARFVARHRPTFDRQMLLKMITEWPADALGMGDQCGTLSTGKRADFTVVALPKVSSNPLVPLFEEESQILATFVGGQRVA